MASLPGLFYTPLVENDQNMPQLEVNRPRSRSELMSELQTEGKKSEPGMKLLASLPDDQHPLLWSHDAERGQPQAVPVPSNGILHTFKQKILLFQRRLPLIFCTYWLLWPLYHNWDRFYGSMAVDDIATSWALDAFSHQRMTAHAAEELFLSVPSPDSALNTSRSFANVPHLAGSDADYNQATKMLSIFENELGIPPPHTLPLYEAGSELSRNATLDIPSLNEKKAWIDTYFPIMNTPGERHLQVLEDDGTVVWNADVEERAAEGDPAGEYAKAVGAWHGLSKGGDVTGKLIYANYGSKQDFDELASKGVDLRGTIVIVRYGGLFRGLKVKGAQEAGAVGCLIYSDLRDDGTVTEKNGYSPYPNGPSRNPDSVQRGSVQFISKYPGDPSTPGEPAYRNATRVGFTNVPSIPSIPISWNNAKRLLSEISPDLIETFSLDGKMSQRAVRLSNQVHDGVIPIWNTMAVIPGHVKSEVVVVGCHRDAWVIGAADPTSGTAALVEVVKGFGALLRKGWKPLKTVVFASWDAEEYGLIGSTEWAEDFPDFIAKHVVTYLNTDVASSGSRFHLGASPSLAHLLKDAAVAIPHPTDPKRTLWDARLDTGKLTGPPTAFEDLGVDWQNELYVMGSLQDSDSTGVRPLGSGSDYTAFLQRIGVASSDIGFGSTLQDPVYHYHSVYDSVRFQEVYADPGFVRHTAVAKHLGLVALRLLDTPLLPLNTTQYAVDLHSYLKTVENVATFENITVDFSPLRKAVEKVAKASKKLDKSKARAAHELKKAIAALEKHRKEEAAAREGCAHRSWPKTRERIKAIFGVKPEHRHMESALNVTLEQSSDASTNGHHRAHEVLRETLEAPHDDHGKPKLPKAVRRVMKAAQVVVAHNKVLASFERGFIDEAGIKDREWYRNLVVAPGKWTGYGATTFPALTEAIQVERNATLVEVEVQRLSGLLHRLAGSMHAWKHHC